MCATINEFIVLHVYHVITSNARHIIYLVVLGYTDATTKPIMNGSPDPAKQTVDKLKGVRFLHSLIFCHTNLHTYISKISLMAKMPLV